jgi:hypothetical protein
MGPAPFAFSVHNFISSVGADAGFAAIIGLAILVLLYFAHARETANLREEAVALSERLAQAEAAVAQLSLSQGVPVAPAPVPASVQVTDQRRSVAQTAPDAPFAPAGVAAPALAAATRAIPVAQPAPQQPAPQQPAPQSAPQQPAPQQPAPTPVPEPQRPPTSQPAIATASVAAAAATATASGVAAAEAAKPDPPPGVLRPATVAGANGSGHDPARPAPVGVGLGPPAPPSQAQAPPLPLPPLGDTGPGRSSTPRRVALALGALLVVAAAVVLVAVTATGTSSPGSTSVPASNAPPAPGHAAFAPSSVTVAVLNGTSTNQLAHRVAAKLAASGYKEGRVATAANQTETSTVVAYLPGGKNRRDALHVATALKLRPSSVRPIDQPAQQVACPLPGACTANVVVTVGADLATL